MRVLVVGATGVIGRRVVFQLLERGHEVVGTFRSSSDQAAQLRGLGVEIIPLDVLDRAAVREVVLEIKPDAVVHEATALANVRFSRALDKTFAQTNRLRTEGTDNLLEAARAVGVQRFVAQSFAPYRYARQGGLVKVEDDPLDHRPPKGAWATNAAMTYLENAVLDAGGIALRYGGFYGDTDSQMLRSVRKRRFPIIGDGAGVTSWVHLDDAASATALAVEHDGPAIYNIVDDEPARARDWLPALAVALGAKPPRRIPEWVIRLLAGEDVVTGATQARGASNAKAKQELGWRLRYPTWRDGFVATYRPELPGRRSLAAHQ